MQLCRQVTRWLLGRQIHVNRDNHGWLSMGQNNTMKKSVYCPHTIHPGQFAVGQLQANYPMKKVFPVHTIHPAWYAGECRFTLPAPCVKQGHSGTVGKVLKSCEGGIEEVGEKHIVQCSTTHLHTLHESLQSTLIPHLLYRITHLPKGSSTLGDVGNKMLRLLSRQVVYNTPI